MDIPRLHVVTDSLEIARAALSAGAPLIQVRVDDEVPDRAAFELSMRIAQECDAYGAICLINDRLDVALAVGAAGAHVGADDLPIDVSRRILGEQAILGASARTPARVREVGEYADYLGCGQVNPSFTKDVAAAVIGPAGLADVIAAGGGIPVIAIGGITVRDVPAVLAAGAHGIAVIGAIRDAADPASATAELLRALG